MRIEVRFKDEVAIVGLSGRFLAGGDGPFLRQKIKDLIDAGTRMLVIDFGGVPYIDSTGLGFLAGSRVTAQNAGVNTVLASVNPHVKKILDQVKLSQFFVIAENEDAAIAKAKEPAPPATNPDGAPPKESRGRKRPSTPDA